MKLKIESRVCKQFVHGPQNIFWGFAESDFQFADVLGVEGSRQDMVLSRPGKRITLSIHSIAFPILYEHEKTRFNRFENTFC